MSIPYEIIVKNINGKPTLHIDFKKHLWNNFQIFQHQYGVIGKGKWPPRCSKLTLLEGSFLQNCVHHIYNDCMFTKLNHIYPMGLNLNTLNM